MFEAASPSLLVLHRSGHQGAGNELKLGCGRRPGLESGANAVAISFRQTQAGKAGFIASSKNKTRKRTMVLSESDVYFSLGRCSDSGRGGHSLLEAGRSLEGKARICGRGGGHGSSGGGW